MKFMKAALLSLALSLSAFSALAADTVNLNTADAATIATKLNGIGMAKAEAIVAYREAHGPFKSIDQLAEVKGVGLKTVEKNRALLSVGAPAKSQP